jgi:hypothetical protein
VTSDEVWFFTKSGKLKPPYLPPYIHNDGNRIVSISRLVRWLAPKVEELGVQIFPGFPAAELLHDGDRVVGVRTGDKGVDKHGQKKANYEPGIDIRAKLTILAEGTRGSLTKQLGRQARARPRPEPAGVRDRYQGTVAHPRLRREEQGARDPHARLAARHEDVRRRLRVLHGRRSAVARFRHRPSITKTRRPTRTRSSKRSSSTRTFANCCKVANSCATARRRSPKADGGRGRGRSSTAR